MVKNNHFHLHSVSNQGEKLELTQLYGGCSLFLLEIRVTPDTIYAILLNPTSASAHAHISAFALDLGKLLVP